MSLESAPRQGPIRLRAASFFVPLGLLTVVMIAARIVSLRLGEHALGPGLVIALVFGIVLQWSHMGRARYRVLQVIAYAVGMFALLIMYSLFLMCMLFGSCL